MKKTVLESLGFQEIQRKVTSKKQQEQTVPTALVSKEGSQLRIRIPRKVMKKMHWEISQRVKIMINEDNGTVALIRARKEDKNSYSIGFQSTTKENAIKSGYPGVVRVSTSAFKESNGRGAFQTPLIHDRSTIVLNLKQAA